MFVRLLIVNSLSREENGSEFTETDDFKPLTPKETINFSYEPKCMEYNAILPTKEYKCRSSVVFAECDEFNMCYNPNGYYSYDFEDPTHFKILKINENSIILQIFNAKQGTYIDNGATDFENYKSFELDTNIVELKKNYSLSFSQSSSNHIDTFNQLVLVEDIFE